MTRAKPGSSGENRFSPEMPFGDGKATSDGFVKRIWDGCGICTRRQDEVGAVKDSALDDLGGFCFFGGGWDRGR